MKTFTQILIVLIIIACVHLTFITLIAVMTGSDPGSVKFLIPVGVAFICTLVGLGYSRSQTGSAFLVGVVIPLVCIGYAYNWNQSSVTNQRKDKEDRIHATCTKVMDTNSPNGYGYYYLCENGQVVYSVK